MTLLIVAIAGIVLGLLLVPFGFFIERRKRPRRKGALHASI